MEEEDGQSIPLSKSRIFVFFFGNFARRNPLAEYENTVNTYEMKVSLFLVNTFKEYFEVGIGPGRKFNKSKFTNTTVIISHGTSIF